MQSEFKSFCQKRTDGRVYGKMTKTKAEHFAADLKTDFKLHVLQAGVNSGWGSA